VRFNDQAYGYHHIPLFIALEKLNLLSSTTAPAYPFPTLRKSLRLIVDDVDDATPNDVSYVYSGYAPISIRLVQCVAQKNAIMATAPTPRQNGQAEEASGRSRILPQAHSITGWRGFEDVVAGIPGATVDIRQKSESGVPERSECHGPCSMTRRWLMKSIRSGQDSHYCSLLPGRLHVCRACGIEVDV
jgi:hypothetical protein